MATNNGNFILKGNSGRLGNFVLTPDNIRTRPDFSKRILSQDQKNHLSRFELAKTYGRMVIRNEALNSYYGEKARKLKGKGAWHLAIEHYFMEPDLWGVNFWAFNKRAGDCIRIIENNKYKLGEIEVTLVNAAGDLIEKGSASVVPGTGDWEYRIQHDIEPGATITFIFRIVSLPGHMIEKTMTVTGHVNGIVLFAKDPARAMRHKSRMKSQLRHD